MRSISGLARRGYLMTLVFGLGIFIAVGLLIPSICLAATIDVVAYDQNNSAWASIHLGTSGYTIGSAGCAATSAAMVANYYGSGKDPGQFVTSMNSLGGINGDGDIIWSSVPVGAGGTISGPVASNTNGNNLALIASYLDGGTPVIVRTTYHYSDGSTSPHWVVLTGHDGNTYYMNDPAGGAKNANFNANYGDPSGILGYVVYSGVHVAPTDDNAISIRADFNGDGRTDVALITPRGPGINVSVLTSSGSTLAYAGLWYYDSGVDFNNVKVVAGDFNGDGKTDLLYATDRGPGINCSMLLSTGSGFTWSGLWYYDNGVDFKNFKITTGDFNGDARTDVALVTPRGPGINVTILTSSGTALAYAGLWYYDNGVDFNNVKVVGGDFNGDGKTDLLYATDRGPGINCGALLSTGSGFTWGGLWYYDNGVDFKNFKIITGNFNGDGRTDLAVVTPRGPGINVTILTSSGTALTYRGLWYYDSGVDFNNVKVVAGDFNGDGKTDLLYATDRGPGINCSMLLSTGSGFTWSGLWYYDNGVSFSSFGMVSGDGEIKLAPAPTITSVAPTSGTTAGGTSVTITGTNLTGATAVTFGGSAGTITANAATSITVTSPAHAAGTVDVQVTTPGGVSSTSGTGDDFTYTAPPAYTRYDQTDIHIVKSGTWANYASTSSFNGSYGRASTASASATIYFTGTRLDYIAMKGTTTGYAEVWVDGAKVTGTTPINLYASPAKYQQNVWSTGTLSNGDHIVKIVRSASSATGKYLTLDAVDIYGTISDPPVTKTRYEQTNTVIKKTGTWSNYASTSSSGKSYGRSSTSTASATIKFVGTQLDYIAMKGTTTGYAEVWVDGVKVTGTTPINLYASSAAYQQNIYSTGTLAFGLHTVKIVRASASATGKYLTLDAFDVWGWITS